MFGDANTDRLPKVKNVILFIGDGLDMSTMTAARILKGQNHGRVGEYEQLIWDQFPSVAHVRVGGFLQFPRLIFSQRSHFSREKSAVSFSICSRLIQSKETRSKRL